MTGNQCLLITLKSGRSCIVLYCSINKYLTRDLLSYQVILKLFLSDCHFNFSCNFVTRDVIDAEIK